MVVLVAGELFALRAGGVGADLLILVLDREFLVGGDCFGGIPANTAVFATS